MKEDFEFLHKKLPELQTSSDVEDAVEREERHTGKKIPNDPAERIEAYMDRLENIFLNPDERTRERNLEMFRDKIYDALIIKRENFPESYFELQKRIARERGEVVEEISENVRRQMMEVAIEDQKHSLDAWTDYLSEEDVAYPTWFKYFVWRNITKLSQFDKELGKFKERTSTTVARFPDIHRGALAQILDVYEKVKADNKNLKEPEIREAFSKKFPALYAELISKSLAASMENREEIRGQWMKYAQGNNTDAENLFESMQGQGTGWCVEGKTTASSYIKQGDFYVYYTNDASGEPTHPRLAIQMSGSQIGQIRGVLPHQSVEPLMQEVLDEKLAEFGSEADTYRRKSEDMKLLTQIENKTKKNEPLTKDEFIFLYEIDSPIQGFGYESDPRIQELRQGRNSEEDMLVIFECVKEEIAHVPKEINNDTKAYIGEWNPTIFQTIKQYPNIKHLYESFPDKEIFMRHMETDPTVNSPEKAEESLKAKNIYLSEWGKDILYKTEFSTESKTYELVQFTVAQLDFPKGATTDEIYAKAIKLGLELAPAEIGPYLRLQYGGRDWKLIAMKQILTSDGYPSVFSLDAGGVGLELDAYRARPSRRWYAVSQFVFCSRKKLEASES
ncbi:MAG: hypothetical protein Q7S11_03175 [bacterium]|nr:hypothetical protein [bacterium]